MNLNLNKEQTKITECYINIIKIVSKPKIYRINTLQYSKLKLRRCYTSTSVLVTKDFIG